MSATRFVRCCRLHPSVEVVEGTGGPLWCSTGHEVRSWLIRDLLTGRIVGRSHWLNGGNLDHGALESAAETVPEPPTPSRRCRRGHLDWRQRSNGAPEVKP